MLPKPNNLIRDAATGSYGRVRAVLRKPKHSDRWWRHPTLPRVEVEVTDPRWHHALGDVCIWRLEDG